VAFSTDLVAEIQNLVLHHALDATEVNDTISTLTRDLKLAVGSYLGLQLTVYSQGHPVTLTVFEPSAEVEDITTTVTVPLGSAAGTEAPSVMTVYAATPGALVDLAADLGYALKLPDGVVALDRALRPTTTASGLTGLSELGAINRAIGVLMDQGHHPDHAYHELHRQAVAAKISVPDRAAQLLFQTLTTQQDRAHDEVETGEGAAR